MDRKLGGLIVAGLLCAPPVSAQAPFCVVSQSGQQSCFYHSLDACRQAAAAMNGACATNGGSQGPAFYDMNKAIQKPDIAGSFMRGAAEGQRRRIEQEEHDARMELMRAQAEDIRQQQVDRRENSKWERWAKESATPASGTVIYDCPTDQGISRTYTAAAGCTVAEIVP